MALRNYLYAKHPDPVQTALINQEPSSCHNAIQLLDGTKQCANCADCPKKSVHDTPQVKVQLDREIDFNEMELVRAQ